MAVIWVGKFNPGNKSFPASDQSVLKSRIHLVYATFNLGIAYAWMHFEYCSP
jgi:hypothetical protein